MQLIKQILDGDTIQFSQEELDELGWEIGQELEISEENGKIIIKKL